MSLNREIKTDLFNILESINCAEDYGYADDVFYWGQFKMINPVTDEEIKAFVHHEFLTEEGRAQGYSEEDAEESEARLIALRNKYREI